MKKATTLAGSFGALFIALGIVFKLMHWPGASIIITIGATLLAIYSLLLINNNIKTADTGITKAFVIFFGLMGVFLPLGFLFKMMHWPYAGAIIVCFFIAWLCLLTVCVSIGISGKDQNQRQSYINYFIWLLAGILMLSYPVISGFIN